MNKWNLLNKWKRRSINLAKHITNYDTGNIVENAIKNYNGTLSFTIFWDESEAFYIKFVNDGTQYIQKYDFVGKTAEAIVEMIEDNKNAFRFIDRPSDNTLKRRIERNRDAQRIWQQRTQLISNKEYRFRR